MVFFYHLVFFYHPGFSLKRQKHWLPNGEPVLVGRIDGATLPR
jgi:hypothetical protein